MRRETRGRLVSVVLLLALSLLFALLPANTWQPSKPWFLGVVFTVFVCLVSWLVVRQAQDFRSGGGHGPGQLRGLVNAVWFALLFFAYAYFTLAQRGQDELPGLHTKLDAMYFTLSTVSTVGFGDITAASQAARAVVCVNIIFNLVIVALAVSSIQHRAQGGSPTA